jgi:hypothetical protein
MTVDEVRELEGMQPLPADVLAQPNPQPSMNPNATN